MLHASAPAIISQGASFSQMKPSSSVQRSEQPSPLRMLPSSHSSSSTMPSPQLDVHAVVGPVHVGSRRQLGAQPSKPTVLPSSQLSAPSTSSSPHVVGSQVLGLPMHFQPISIWQRALQPSPAITPPSSQPSFESSRPSPHRCTS